MIQSHLIIAIDAYKYETMRTNTFVKSTTILQDGHSPVKGREGDAGQAGGEGHHPARCAEGGGERRAVALCHVQDKTGTTTTTTLYLTGLLEC